jgi:hypothetical protein
VSLTAKPPRCIAPAKPSLSNLRWRSDSAAGLGIGFVGKILPETVVDHQVPGAFLIFFPFSQSNDLQYLGIRWYKSKRSAPPKKKQHRWFIMEKNKVMSHGDVYGPVEF